LNVLIRTQLANTLVRRVAADCTPAMAFRPAGIN
jgi:hypothetical protein